MDFDEIDWPTIIVKTLLALLITFLLSKLGCKDYVAGPLGGGISEVITEPSRESGRAWQNELEKQKQQLRQQEQELQRVLDEQRRWQEEERQRQVAAEQNRQREAERQRQVAAEQNRRQEAERQRQVAAEQNRQREAERQRQVAAEQSRQQEAERQRQVAAEQSRARAGTITSLISVWTDSPGFQFSVYVDGQYIGDCTSSFSNDPNCGRRGTVNDRITAGDHLIEIYSLTGKKLTSRMVRVSPHDECLSIQFSRR